MTEAQRNEAGSLRHITLLGAQIPLKLILPMALLVFALTVVVTIHVYNIRAGYEAIERQGRHGLAELMNQLQQAVAVLDSSDGHDITHLNLSKLAGENQASWLVLLDDQYRVLATSGAMADANDTNLPSIDLEQQILEWDDAIASVRAKHAGLIEASPEGDRLTAVYPVSLQNTAGNNSSGRPGILIAQQNLVEKRQAERRMQEDRLKHFSALILLLTGMLWLALHLIISRRVNFLVDATRRLVDDPFYQRINMSGNDECALIAKTIDFMAERLHKQQEQAEATKTLLNQAQRTAKIGNWELNLKTGHLFWSDEIFRLFDVDKSRFDATYEGFLQAIHPEDRDAVNDAYSLSLETRSPYIITHRLQKQDGSIMWVEERCSTDFDSEGNPLISRGTVQDITDRKQIEDRLAELNKNLEARILQRTLQLKNAKEEAEHANQLKSEFLGRMSHELRTPLNAIIGFSQLLSEEAPSEIHREFNREVLSAADHLLQLIDEILELTKIEAGKINVAAGTVDLYEIAQDVISLTSTLAKERDLIVRNQCNAATRAYADPFRVKQVLLNLVTNAIKYNVDGGRVEIKCRKTGVGRLRIEVQDTGIGIAAEQQSVMFEPFNRLGKEYSDIEGTGIGLSICRELVELMGGDIGVESAPGEGTTVWFELSSDPSEAAAESEPAKIDPLPATTRSTSDKVVLYIEDNRANVRLLENVIKKMPGLTLINAENAEQGIEIARSLRPALVLLDLNLPGMDGFEALETLKSLPETRDLTYFALSAAASPIDIEKGLRAGFERYLTKPIQLDELRQALREGLN